MSGVGKKSRDLLFLCDAMHGKLCRWLRILGFDTEYWNGPDDGLFLKASREGRIIITSDVEAFRSALGRGIEAILVEQGELHEVLASIAYHLHKARRIDVRDFLSPSTSRCSVCNGELEWLANESWSCIRCGKLFWKGSHWRGITATLQQALAAYSSIKASH